MTVARPLTLDDAERCMDLAQRVGWPRETVKWELLLEMGPAWGLDADAGALESNRPERPLDAMVVIPTYDAASFVAMMVVAPPVQGAGVGRKLLEHALEDALEPTMLYATERGFPLYQRLGFVEVARAQKHIGTPRPTTTRGVRVATRDDHATIHAEDTRAFGLPRSRLISALLARADRIVVDDRGGFALRWFNGHLGVVGPVVAHDEDAAIALVDAALEGCTTQARVDLAVGSARFKAHLKELGLASFGEAPLMTRPKTLPGDRSRYHAIALQAFG